MKQIILAIFLTLSALALPAWSQTGIKNPQIIIIELQTASLDSASDEFIEIYNPSLETVLLDDWRLQYKSASGSNWLSKANLSGEILPRTRLLISTEAYESNFDTTGGFAASGGHIQLVDGAEQTSDLLAWGSANEPETAVALAPKKGESLKRVLDEDGFFIDTGDNSSNFFVSISPSPQFDVYPEEVEIEDNPADDSKPPEKSDGAPPEDPKIKSNASISLTELFIDPDKPLTDAEDEFVEIFNPNDRAVNLIGYVIETGDSYSYSFALPAITIQPKSYLPIFSVDSNLTLSNSSGRARISDPSGKVLDETDRYEKAKPGDSWALVNGVWIWLEIPTPGQPNGNLDAYGSFGESISDRSALVAGANSNSTDATASSQETRNVFEEPATAPSAELNKTILAGVALMALLYGIYEYRHDFGNRFNQLRKYLADRHQNGSSTSRGRSDRIGQRFGGWKDSLRERISQGYEKFRSSS